MRIIDSAKRAAINWMNSPAAVRRRMPDVDPKALEIFARVRPFTMTTPERVFAVCQAVRYVEAAGIPGAFVECGVYRGGSSMAAALSFTSPRDLFLFDTFEGMSPPTEADQRAVDSTPADRLLGSAAKDEMIWCYSPIDEVSANMASTGYPSDKVHLVKGMVEDTLPAQAPDQIAILRLDTDWYESTRHELEHLYPRLAPGGVLIIDDYGYWAGARKAVDEYFDGKVLLHRIDATGRMLVKAG
jgi:hypothetical protein